MSPPRVVASGNNQGRSLGTRAGEPCRASQHTTGACEVAVTSRLDVCAFHTAQWPFGK